MELRDVRPLGNGGGSNRSCGGNLSKSVRASHPRVTALIDLENFLHGSKGLLSPEHARPFLSKAMRAIPDSGHCIAVAPARVIGRYVSLLHELSISTAVVPPGPNAADLALLEQAEHLASIGYQRFVVLSGDHIFSELSKAFPTTVIVRHNKSLARALKEAAASVVGD